MSEPVPFEMTRLELLRCSFCRNPSWEGHPGSRIASATLTIRNTGGFSPQGDSARFVQAFRTEEGALMPFSLEVEYGAVFSMSRPVPPEERPFYIHRAFPCLIFPFMREYVAETTRRGGFPPLVINMSADRGPWDGAGPGAPDGGAVLKWIH
ncbi:MAG: protein-export chaperone SecB [Deltaproteobacteria bacterium]|jgi:hypothetical protein|nr:protein-export chaperone SecB [Deltaproteobacteria bacterium]